MSQGTVDVLGYSPGRVANPLAAIGELPAGHPYASIGAEKVRDAVAWLRDTLGEELLVGDPAQNYVLPTAVGAMRPTALAQPSMVAAHQAASYAVVGVRQLKDFPAELLAGNLGCRAAWVDLPARREADSSGHMFARAIEDPAYAKRFAAAVAAAAPDGAVLLLPAILGVKPGTWRRVADQVGRPIAEVPMQPPSVPGIRLHDALLAKFKAAGGRVIIGSRVTDAMTRSWASNGVSPGPSMCSPIFTSGCSLMRVPVSEMPVTCARVSTPSLSRNCVVALAFAP